MNDSLMLGIFAPAFAFDDLRPRAGADGVDLKLSAIAAKPVGWGFWTGAGACCGGGTF